MKRLQKLWLPDPRFNKNLSTGIEARMASVVVCPDVSNYIIAVYDSQRPWSKDLSCRFAFRR